MKIISSKEGLDGSLKIHWNDIQGAKSPWTKMNSIPVSICLKVFLNGEGIDCDSYYTWSISLNSCSCSVTHAILVLFP